MNIPLRLIGLLKLPRAKTFFKNSEKKNPQGWHATRLSSALFVQGFVLSLVANLIVEIV